MKKGFTKFMSFVLSLVMLLSVLVVYEQPQTITYAALITGTFNIDTDTLPYTQEQIYTQLFDINNKIEIDIDMSDEELQKMQDDYDKYSDMGSKSPIYRMADVDITITTSTDKYTYQIEEVGVRMKGNTSRCSFYNSSDGIYNLVHLKLDFQETFEDTDYYGEDAKVWPEDANGDSATRDARKERIFATLEKIDMKWNRCDDTTYIREYYAYETYRANGVLAPHTNLASIDWGPEGSYTHTGVYTIYEPIDKIFLEKYLPEEDQGGDLYKVGWAGTNNGSFANTNSIGKEDEDNAEFYAYDIKTNKKKTDHSSLINMINTLNGELLTKEQVASIIDMDEFLKFAAVSYFMGNPDDIRNNYNNYYLYFLKSTGKAIFIPYDFDRCLGIRAQWDPTGDGCSTDNPFSDMALGANGSQKNPVFIYTVDKGGYYVKEFAEVLNKVANNEWLTANNFDKYFNIAKTNYASDVTPSKTFYNTNSDYYDYKFTFDNETVEAENGNYSFKHYITTKKSKLAEYMADVDEYATVSIALKKYYYIRGTFTDWEINDKYNMSCTSGKAKYMLELDSDASFKVYNNDSDQWYGSEVISENNVIEFSTDDMANIYLPAGKYVITYDENNGSIIIKYPSTVNSSVTELKVKSGDAPVKIADLGITTTGSRELSYSSSDENVIKYDATNKTFNIVGVGSAYIVVTANETDTYELASKSIKVTVESKDIEIGKDKEENKDKETDKDTSSDKNIQVDKDTEQSESSKVDQTIIVKNIFKKYFNTKSFKLNAKAKTKLTYTSSNKKIATVSASGKVTFKKYGTVTITIKAKATDEYNEAVKKVTVYIHPNKVKLTSVKSPKKNTMVVKWKRDAKASGYQIIYANNKKFKNSKNINISKNKTVTRKITKLKAGKKYFVKVRAYYKTKNGNKYYGKPSVVKSVSIKK